MKETRKQIVEQTRNKLSRKHQQELDFLMEKFEIVHTRLEEAKKKNREYQEEIESLRLEIRDLKELNKELMFLADITDDDMRKVELENYLQRIRPKTKVEKYVEYIDDMWGGGPF